MPSLIDTYDFARTPKHTLGSARRALATELREELGDRTWEGEAEPESDDEGLYAGLTIIDQAEFDDRYGRDADVEIESACPLTHAERDLLQILIEWNEHLKVGPRHIKLLERLGYWVMDEDELWTDRPGRGDFFCWGRESDVYGELEPSTVESMQEGWEAAWRHHLYELREARTWA